MKVNNTTPAVKNRMPANNMGGSVSKPTLIPK